MTMKARTLLVIAIVFCGLSAVARINAQTTTVRGQLLKNGQSPAPGITVTLNHPTFGRSSPATTGGDGMYYFYNVPFGDYYLEVWLSNHQPSVYPMRIFTAPYCDLPRIPVP
jgi:hypothetical protein